MSRLISASPTGVFTCEELCDVPASSPPLRQVCATCEDCSVMSPPHLRLSDRCVLRVRTAL